MMKAKHTVKALLALIAVFISVLNSYAQDPPPDQLEGTWTRKHEWGFSPIYDFLGQYLGSGIHGG
jgi:hypothetical protein